MYPEKYSKDLKKSRDKKKTVWEIAVSLGFTASFLIVGPLIHELGHVAVVEYINCPYTFSLDFAILSGLYGSISPFCSLTTIEAVAFYISGYAATILLGTLTLSASYLYVKRRKALSLISAGLFMSVLLGLGHGDLPALSNYVAPGQTPMILSVLLIVLAGTTVSLNQLFRKEEDQKE